MIIGMKGVGTISIKVGNINDQKVLFDTPPMNCKIARDQTVEKAAGYPTCGKGSLLDFYSEASEEMNKIFCEHKIFDWGILQLLWNEFADVADFTYRDAYCGIIPSSSPYTVTNSALTGATVDSISVVVPSSARNAWTPLKVVSASASANQVELDGTDLIFHSGLAGKDYKLFITTQYTEIETIGVSEADSRIGTVEHLGQLVLASKPNKIAYRAPSAYMSGNPSIGAKETNAVEYTCLVEGSNVSAIQFANFG